MGVSARALRAGKAIIECSLLVKPVFTQLRALQTRVQSVGKSFARIGTFGVAGGGFAGLRNLFIGSAAATAAAWPVKLAANLEMATAQLGTFMSSEQAARDLLIELQKFSAVSLVPFEALAQSAAMLTRFGVAEEQVGAHTKALAVLAAGNADEFDKLALAFAQVASAGKLQGEEMRQFKNTAFNPIREIAEKTGETMDQVRQRMEAGGISFQEVANILQSVVGPAGRFDGLLVRISNTLKGQFAKGLAQIKLAVLPLGEEALPILTKWLKALNGIVPAMASVIQQNAGLVRTVLGVVAAVAVAAVVFTSMGLGITIFMIAMSGFGTVLGMISTLLAAIFSPAGIAVAAIGGLVVAFFTATEAGRTMLINLGAYFHRLWEVASQTFDGIAKSLMAGNIQMAGKILWQGLKVVWLEGTQELRRIWSDFKIDYLRSVVSLGAEMEHALKASFAVVQASLIKMRVSIAAFIEKIGKTGEQQQAIDRATEFFHKGIDDKTTTDVTQIVKDSFDAANAIRIAFDALENQASGKAKRELEKARKELQRMVELAGQMAVLPIPDFGLGKQFGAAGALAAASKEAAMKPQAFFDTRLGKQMIGGPMDQQLAQLKKIERNTRRGGLPVV